MSLRSSVPGYSIKADNDYIPRVLLSLRRQETIALDQFDFVRLYWFDWFENRTHSKIGVRFCSIAEPNRTIGVRLGSIGFFVRFCSIGQVGATCIYRLPIFLLGQTNIEDSERQLNSASYDSSEFLVRHLDEYERTLVTLRSISCETYGCVPAAQQNIVADLSYLCNRVAFLLSHFQRSLDCDDNSVVISTPGNIRSLQIEHCNSGRPGKNFQHLVSAFSSIIHSEGLVTDKGIDRQKWH